jgi:hypothetical protein
MTTAKPEAKMARVYIPMTLGTAQFNYAYTTKKATYSDLNSVAGMALVADNSKNLFWGVNTPKPYRITKINDDGSTVSTWCETSKAIALKANENYIVTPPKTGRGGISGSKNVITVYVELKGNATGIVKYGWNMSRAIFTDTSLDVGTNLGIQAATANDLATMIWGVNKPKPPRASKQVKKRVIETFFSPTTAIIDKLGTAGWRANNLAYWDTIITE